MLGLMAYPTWSASPVAPPVTTGPSTWYAGTEADSPLPCPEESLRVHFATGKPPPAPSLDAQRWLATPPSIAWTDLALGLVVTYQQNPLRAARVLSGLNVAIHDALILCTEQGLTPQACLAAGHAAGSEMLEYFYAYEPRDKYPVLGRVAWATLLAALPEQEIGLRRAWEVGYRAAHQVKWRMINDGSDAAWNVERRPAPLPGTWVPTPPLMGYNPVEPTAPGWRPWVLKDPKDIPVPPPPTFGSTAYQEEMREVLAVFRALTPEQKRIAETWNLGAGSVTPPGVWNHQARTLVLEAGLDATGAARVFAALNAALLDALIVGWDVKLTHWTERPVTAVRRDLVPDFLPHLATPTFPGYVSGHAIVSGTAEVVLSAFFPARAGALKGMAEEAAMSRLYGGIHIRSDNEQGLTAGRSLGRRVLEKVEKIGMTDRTRHTRPVPANSDEASKYSP
jgi:hypothetical protein